KMMRLYVNGILRGESELKGEYQAGGSPFMIGGDGKRMDGGIRWPFSGTIDEVRISKVARYPHNFTAPSRFEPDKDTLALYHFDEGTGDVLKDSSGNNHHGKIVGAKWVKAGGTLIAPAVSPPADYALAFDGEKNHVLIPTLSCDDNGPRTVEGYVLATSAKGRL